MELNKRELKILNYLDRNKNEYVYKKQLHTNLNISYPLVLRTLEVLEAKGLIELIVLGHMTIVKINNNGTNELHNSKVVT